ncbi:hypothetical protein BJX99DRAFT_219562 [Aspergillus californicus]
MFCRTRTVSAVTSRVVKPGCHISGTRKDRWGRWLKRRLSFEAEALITAPCGAIFPFTTVREHGGCNGVSRGRMLALEYSKYIKHLT